MRGTAMVLGILGGLCGLLMALLTIGGGLLNAGVGGQADTTATLGGFGAAGLAFSVLAFIGAGLTLTKPRAAAVLLLIAGVGTLVSLSAFAILATPLLLIAALLAFLGRRPAPVLVRT